MMKRLLHVVTNFTARFALLCGFGLASLLPLYAHQSTEQAIDSTAANTSADQTADSDVPAAPTPQFSSKSTVLLKFCRNSHAAYLWRTPPNLRAFLRHAGRPDRTRIGGSRGPSKKHSSGMGTGRCRLRHASGLSLRSQRCFPHGRCWRRHRGPRGLAVATLKRDRRLASHQTRRGRHLRFSHTERRPNASYLSICRRLQRRFYSQCMGTTEPG